MHKTLASRVLFEQTQTRGVSGVEELVKNGSQRGTDEARVEADPDPTPRDVRPEDRPYVRALGSADSRSCVARDPQLWRSAAAA